MKRIAVLVLVLGLIFTAFAATPKPMGGRNLSLDTGSNMLPACLDAFPAFNHNTKTIDQIELWIWADDVTEKADYIKLLQRAGFKNTDNGTYSKGNAEVWFDDSSDAHTVVFTLSSANGSIKQPLQAVLQAFPAFKPEQFGNIFSIDFDLYYSNSVPQSTIDGYVKDMNAAGFVYVEEYEDYELETDEKQYYFTIEEDDDYGKYYSWSVLYY
jgi:hypothetical protein